jgi:hypothetical protein
MRRLLEIVKVLTGWVNCQLNPSFPASLMGFTYVLYQVGYRRYPSHKKILSQLRWLANPPALPV